MNLWGAADRQPVCTACPAGGLAGSGARAGQESLMVGSWCPPNSEVHGLVLHGLAVRSFSCSQLSEISFQSKKLPAKRIALVLVALAILIWARRLSERLGSFS